MIEYVILVFSLIFVILGFVFFYNAEKKVENRIDEKIKENNENFEKLRKDTSNMYKDINICQTRLKTSKQKLEKIEDNTHKVYRDVEKEKKRAINDIGNYKSEMIDNINIESMVNKRINKIFSEIYSIKDHTLNQIRDEQNKIQETANKEKRKVDKKSARMEEDIKDLHERLSKIES